MRPVCLFEGLDEFIMKQSIARLTFHHETETGQKWTNPFTKSVCEWQQSAKSLSFSTLLMCIEEVYPVDSHSSSLLAAIWGKRHGYILSLLKPSSWCFLKLFGHRHIRSNKALTYVIWIQVEKEDLSWLIWRYTQISFCHTVKFCTNTVTRYTVNWETPRKALHVPHACSKLNKRFVSNLMGLKDLVLECINGCSYGSYGCW